MLRATFRFEAVNHSWFAFRLAEISWHGQSNSQICSHIALINASRISLAAANRSTGLSAQAL